MPIPPPLSLEPLERAIAQLEAGLAEAASAPENTLLRDGVIQRFEYTIDLSWELMQRYLRQIAQIDDAVLRTKKDIFRESARLRLVASAEAWIAHYEARNETSHGYDAQTADRVFREAVQSAPDVRSLLGALHDATRSAS